MKMEPDGKARVQWGTASNADTTTGQTGATPSPPQPPKDSTSASAAGHPFSPSEGGPVWLQQLVQDLNTPPLPDFKPMDLSKQGYLVKLTGEQLEDAEVWPVTIPSPEEQAAGRAANLAEAKARIAGITAQLALAHPALHPVIELHSPNQYGECVGCDAAEERPEWPCSTIELILEGLE